MIQIEVDDRVLRQLIADSDSHGEEILTQASQQVIDGWRKSMKASKGRPGDAPRVRSGKLRDSLDFDADASESVLSGVFYGSIQDKGNHPFVDDGLPTDDDIADIARRVLGG